MDSRYHIGVSVKNIKTYSVNYIGPTLYNVGPVSRYWGGRGEDYGTQGNLDLGPQETAVYYTQWRFLMGTLYQIKIGHTASYNAQHIFWVLSVRVLSQVLPPHNHNSNLWPPTRHSHGASSGMHAGYFKALHLRP